VQIHGEHKEETKEEKGKTYHRTERRSGSFSRSLTLPCRVNEHKVTADYKEGVLTIHLPKVEGAKTHKIKVQG
jgi:HSP20 family protein